MISKNVIFFSYSFCVDETGVREVREFGTEFVLDIKSSPSEPIHDKALYCSLDSRKCEFPDRTFL
jgi:hypothetical protein